MKKKSGLRQVWIIEFQLTPIITGWDHCLLNSSFFNQYVASFCNKHSSCLFQLQMSNDPRWIKRSWIGHQIDAQQLNTVCISIENWIFWTLSSAVVGNLNLFKLLSNLCVKKKKVTCVVVGRWVGSISRACWRCYLQRALDKPNSLIWQFVNLPLKLLSNISLKIKGHLCCCWKMGVKHIPSLLKMLSGLRRSMSRRCSLL